LNSETPEPFLLEKKVSFGQKKVLDFTVQKTRQKPERIVIKEKKVVITPKCLKRGRGV